MVYREIYITKPFNSHNRLIRKLKDYEENTMFKQNAKV